MTKGGSQSLPTESTTRTISMPEFSDPYYRRMLQGAENAMLPFNPITGQDRYTPYPGERIAPSSMYGDIGASRAMTRGIAQTGIAGMPEAMQSGRVGMTAANLGIGYTDQAVDRLRQTGQYSPTTFSSSMAQKYMSPYMQNVVDVQKDQARRDFNISQARRNADAVSAGAFGGSRRGVVDALAQEELQRQLGNIQATGQQQAFEQAARQFEADRADRQFGIGQRLAGEQAALGAARQLGGMGQQFANIGAGLATLGERQRAADIQGAQLLDVIGRDIRAEDQARLDLSYEDFIRQREYPQQQYERIAAILRGLPAGVNIQEQELRRRNPIQDALGAGISALGLYKGLTR
tara:strand:- start:33 stop:1079 length:1047 start_codon:yes stop_codon:yes gene_type:complete